MNLVEAFRAIGPIVEDGDPRNAARQAAARVLLDEIARLIARCGLGDTLDREDAAQETLRRLVQNGPRGERPEDPETDEQVRAWLYKAIQNGVITRLRQRKGKEDPLPLDRARVSSSALEVALDQQRARAEIAEARRALFTEIAASVAARRGPRAPAFEQALGELRALAEGRTGFAELLARERAGDESEEGTRRARDRLDQRHSRCRRALLEEIQRRADVLPSVRMAALRIVVDELVRGKGT